MIYRFKKQWNDGTQAVLFSPLEFIEKLVALVAPPRIHLTRFHGVLAPNSHLRSRVVPGQLSDAVKTGVTDEEIDQKPKKPQRLSWSELLKRVFKVDINFVPYADIGIRDIIPTSELCRTPPNKRLFYPQILHLALARLGIIW
jgi:hypothetical protein